jgi:hypothetical protein
MNKSEGTHEIVNAALAAGIIRDLVPVTQGPREAYAILVLAIWLLNFEIGDEKASIDDLCAEVVASLRSISAPIRKPS